MRADILRSSPEETLSLHHAAWAKARACEKSPRAFDTLDKVVDFSARAQRGPGGRRTMARISSSEIVAGSPARSRGAGLKPWP